MFPRTITVLACAAAGVVLASVSPVSALAWLAKEGPVEHVSHAVLAAAVVAWIAASRAGGGGKTALVMAGFLALVLAEEIDWGSVYGWTPIGERVLAVFGHRNMHNAVRGMSYQLFALPLIVYYLSPRTARWSGPVAPTTDERAAFVAVAGLFLASNRFPGWERAAQELLELLLYALLLATGARLARRRGRPEPG